MSPPDRSAEPTCLTQVARRVEARLGQFLAGESQRWVDVDDHLAEALDELTSTVLSGGKRLRPAFCHWAAVGAGGAADDPLVLDCGAALELLHAFALIHDDVMDGSPTRRGTPTMHKRFEARHAERQWLGERRRVGEAIAILLGDLCHVYADVLVEGLPDHARRIWNELRVELNVGQYLDIVATADPEVDEARSRRIVRYKSGLYTIVRPLHLGAAIAGRPDLADALGAYGLPLGDAFQLRDDILGAFGDSELTGKPVGDDLREGKATPLLARALAHASPAQREVLATVGHDLDLAAIDDIRQILVDTGALAEIDAEITNLIARSVDAVTRADLDPEATHALVALAEFIGHRDH